MLIFGFTGILGHLISASAVTLVWHRMWIAALVVFAFLFFTNKSDLNFRGAWKIILAGAIIAAHWVTFFHSIKISTVSVTLATISTGAFFGSIIEPVIYRRRLNPKELLLGIMVIVGLYLIFRFEGDYLAGILVALLSAFLAALFQVVNGKLVKTYSAHRITLLEMFGGWLCISLYLFFTNSLNTSLFSLQSFDWLWLLLLGTVCTAFAFIQSVAVMKEISPFTVLLSINLEPLYGILLALLIFGDDEKMSPWFYVGAGIILSSLFLDVYIRRMKRRSLTVTQNL